MRRLALKFAYLGGFFYGLQRQPCQITVEGEIRKALSALDKTPGGPGYSYASRTDKGVSALGNVLVFLSPLGPKELIGYLNSGLEHICFHSYAEVGGEFNPRHAAERWYRYFVPTLDPKGKGTGVFYRGRLNVFDPSLAKETARMFEGTHDFTAFARLEEGENPVRTLKEVNVNLKARISGLPPFVVIDVLGESFLYMMVRYIVGAILESATGRCSAEDIMQLIEDPKNGRKPAPVDPEPLILMDVSYADLEFTKVKVWEREYASSTGERLAELEVWKGLVELK